MKFFFILLFVNLSLFGRDSTSIPDVFIDDLKSGISTSLQFFTAPVRFDEDDWLFASSIAAGTLLMFAFDSELETNKQTIFDRNKLLHSTLLNYGDVDYANIFSIGMYSAGLLTGNEELRITGRLLIESLFLGGSTALLVRVITGRPRPFTGDSPSFNWFKTHWYYQSFPSGHMTVVFAVSTVLAERIDNNWARGGFYGLASLATIERLYSTEHWFSDVIVGALLGYGSAAFALSKYRESKKTASEKDTGLIIFPSINGLNFFWKF